MSVPPLPPSPAEPDEALRAVTVRRLPAGVSEPDVVVREEAVTVAVEGVGNTILLCTPTDLEALAVGFAYSEGLIDDRAAVTGLSVERTGPWSRLVRVQLAAPPAETAPRNLIVTSACGMCGRRIEEGTAGPPVDRTLRIAAGALSALAAAMRERQAVFAKTGGTHAAMLFGADGVPAEFAEDLGRHNALDKTIGKCLLGGRMARGCGAILSGRVSYELVTKAARAGLEVLAAVSAPSSLAVEAARLRGLTLCGFLRGDRMTVYAHPERIG